MRDPYRVAVWGPGAIGKAAMRELLRLPETELVGVLAYNPKKDGADAGALLKREPVGVSVTTDPSKLVALDPECVLHTPRDLGDWRSDEDIVMLLEAGINVVSVLPYHYPRARGADVEQRFIDAGRKGGATLMGAGINPGFMFERLAAVLTGISNDIEYIRLEEYFNCQTVPSAGVLQAFGFGETEEALRANPPAQVTGPYLTMGIQYLADQLGIPLARLELNHRHVIADRDEEIPGVFKVVAGTVVTVAFEWIGYTEGDQPMFQIQVNWFLNQNVRPPEAAADDYWIVEIEGVPSVRAGIEVTGSIVRNEAISERNPVAPGLLVTAIPVVQAIPIVVAAEPGVHTQAMPEAHWKPDMRF